MIAFILIGIVALVAWCVAGEGPWGAGLTFLCVLFAGLLAMNFFEPRAEMLASITSSGMWLYRWDYIALVGLFAAFTFGLREISNRFVPTYFQTEDVTYEVGRWGFGLLTGYVTMAFLLTALHTAPLPRTVTAGSIDEFLDFRIATEAANACTCQRLSKSWLCAHVRIEDGDRGLLFWTGAQEILCRL